MQGRMGRISPSCIRDDVVQAFAHDLMMVEAQRSPSFLTNYRFDGPKENRSASELETRLQKAGSNLLFFIS